MKFVKNIFFKNYSKLNPNIIENIDFYMDENPIWDRFIFKNKYGWINKKRTKILTYGFDYCYEIDNNFGLINDGNILKIVDFNGKILINNCIYIKNLYFNFTLIRTTERKIILMNPERKIILTDLEYMEDFIDYFAKFKRNGKYGWINKNGEIIAEGFNNCSNFSEGFGKFETDKGYGLVDSTGNILIKDVILGDFYFSVLVFKSEEGSGFLRKDGEIIGEGFDECWEFINNFGIFRKDEKEGFIDVDGNILAEGFDRCYPFKDGYAEVFINNIKKWIDISGNIFTKNPYY